MNYRGFLKKHKVDRGQTCNFVAMKGGRYRIPHKDPFLELFVLNLQTLDQFAEGGLVFKVAKSKLYPLIIDIDLDLSVDLVPGVNVDEAYFDLASLIMNEFQLLANPTEAVEVIMTRRPESSYAKTKSGKKIWRAGFHLYILGKYGLELSKTLRERCIQVIDFNDFFTSRWGDIVLSTDEQIYDQALSDRRNGTIMIGSRKPCIKAGPHYIFFNAGWRNAWANVRFLKPGWHTSHEEEKSIFRSMFGRLYSFIWDNDFAPPSSPSSPSSSSPSSQQKFNLKAFLKATEGYVPSNDQWKQLCVFFASQKLDPQKTGELCNAAWKPRRRDETSTFMQKVTSFDVTKASVIRYLTENATSEWDEREIFGVKDMYFNDANKFTLKNKGTWKTSEIFDYFQSVFCWIKGDANFRFIYREQKINHSYRVPFKQVNICVISEFPFSGVADQDVLVEQTRGELLHKLRKIKAPKKFKPQVTKTVADLARQNKLQAKHDQQMKRFNQAQELITLDEDASEDEMKKCLGKAGGPQITQMFLLFKAYHTGRYLREYDSFTYKPFTTKDNTPSDVYNIFPGFPLEKYKNSKIDIKSTCIWTWLHVAISDRREHKLKYILDYFASKLQCPLKKIKKFLCLYGEKTGTGKTSIRFFTQALTSPQSVRFCENMRQFQDKFNALSLGRLFCVVDDIESWTKTQTDELKSKITNDTFQYRKMRMDPVEMPSYEDLICTSNNRTPYIGHNDRRTELIVMNESLKAGSPTVPRDFSWKKFYAELENVEVMGAWFKFLAERDISGVVFNEEYRFSEDALQTNKLESLGSAQRFCIEFFEREHFYEHPKYSHDKLKLLMRCKESDERVISVATSMLFDWYSNWVKTSGRQCCRNKRNFMAELASIGLKPCRMMVGGTRYTVIHFCQHTVKKGISNHLDIPEEFVVLDWHHLNMNADRWKALCNGDFWNLN